jgi:bifunctional DNase/RNase
VCEVEVLGVEIAADDGRVILLLRELGAVRVLPIVVGAREGAAIAAAYAGLSPERPMTHDLMLSTVRALGADISRVTITDRVDGIYHAELTLVTGERVDCRPSDGVALALRAQAPIHCAEQLLVDAESRAASDTPEDDEGAGGERGRDDLSDEAVDDLVARFRAEIDRLGPDGFDGR